MSIQIIKEKVSALNKAEQAELMHFMVELLTTENDISKDWRQEIDRREEALNNGISIGKPAREVITKYINR